MAAIEAIQAALRAEGLDGWLFFDHHNRDPLAYRVLRFQPAQMVTRRWYYLIPAQGEPRKLMHQIESHSLEALPGATAIYSGWRDQAVRLPALLDGMKKVAMQYSPNCAVPYVSNVDAGTVELIRGCGVEVVSSANLIQLFEAVWSPEQYATHKRAGVEVDATRRAAFQKIGDTLRAGVAITEYEVQQFVRAEFTRRGLFTDHGPIVAVNAHASDPHYEPGPTGSAAICPGDLVLIDLWAKLDQPRAVYYDITWTGYCGATPPEAMLNVFAAVAGARDAGIKKAKSATAAGEQLCGYEVDDATRGHLRALGLASTSSIAPATRSAKRFTATARTWTTTRRTIRVASFPGTCFSVEPGVYLPEFGSVARSTCTSANTAPR